MTKLLVKEIDIFQRGVIKKIFNIHQQDKIKNVEPCRRYKLKPWSEVIKECRMKLYGHLLRLNEKTPARLALKEAERKVKKPIGRPETDMDEINWKGSRRIQDSKM